MGFLDKLKPQPRWKNADPLIRLEALKDLDDPVEIGALAEADPDVRVRRAALGKVPSVEVLGRIAKTDADPEARDRAADRLVGIACRSDQIAAAEVADGDLVALTAVRELTDPKRLSTIAKSDAPDAVRHEALAGISDERALSSISRQAKHESTSAAALARLTDASELLEVALHAAHADVAVAAFERVAATNPDLDSLRSIESRAQHKSVSRRARGIIHEREAAEAARVAALEERRRREAALCDAMERAADIIDPVTARAEMARLTEVWSGASADADATTQERFARARTAAETSVIRHEREAAEAEDRRRLRAEAIATRDALCARVETLDGDDVLEQLVPIEEEWQSLLPLVGNGGEADRLVDRFARAVAACRKRHEMREQLADMRRKLEAIVSDAENLSSESDAAALVKWRTLNREARTLAASLSDALRPADDLTARLDAVGATIQEREQARQAAIAAAAEHAKQTALAQLRRLAERARRAIEADTITLREGERLMRDIGTSFEANHKIDGGHEIEEAIARLRTQQEQLAPRVRELREMDEWRRFANAQRQEQLIAMAEAIVASLKNEEAAGTTSDLAATAKALRELHAKWQEVAEAPRQSAQRLWDRFRTATDFIRQRCEVHFDKLRQERAAAFGKKTDMVAEAEALAASTDWAKAAGRFQQLQAEWQAIGPVARDSGRELSQRFRAACATFFSRRREDLADRKKTWSENLAKKEALCERAEALAESADWDAASAELKRMQAEWKTIGPVRRNKSEVVWNRFRAAADRFFERYHHRHEITLATKLAERETLVVELEGLMGPDQSDAPADLTERVQELRTAWNRSVPIPAPEMKALAYRWQIALARVVGLRPDAFRGTDLDPVAVIHRMEKLVARVEASVEELRDPTEGLRLSPTEMLAARLRSALASNAMGGRADEEAKWRSAEATVKEAQAAWQRLAPINSPEAGQLTSRFREACRRVTDRARRHTAPPRRVAEREKLTAV